MNPCVRRRSNLMAPAMDLGHDVRPPFGGPARHEERRRDPVPAGAARLSSRCRCMLSATSPREEDAAMDDVKRQLAKWIDQDRETIIGFLCDFVRAKSPNPPGDTTLAAAHITRFLEAQGLPFRVIAPQATMPNIVGTFEGRGPGRHLVLNGHIDVFPADERNERWTHGPWSGAIANGKIYGRGVADMKAGTSASIFTYAYLYRIREHLKGRLTLTAVSDEETFGPWGARYLMEHHPEVHGDCLLNGEPSSPLTIRFGEKGPLWLRFTTRTRGAHGAYTHLSPSATKISARLIVDLEELTTLEPSVPIDIADALAGAAAAIDEAQGPGAKDIIQRVTVNIGVIQGGQKVNMSRARAGSRPTSAFPPASARTRFSRRCVTSLRAIPTRRWKRSTSARRAPVIRTTRWSASCAPTPARSAGPIPRRSSASAAPTRGCGASAASRGSCTVPFRGAWLRPTSTSRSRSTCTSSACTYSRHSTTSRARREHRGPRPFVLGGDGRSRPGRHPDARRRSTRRRGRDRRRLHRARRRLSAGRDARPRRRRPRGERDRLGRLGPQWRVRAHHARKGRARGSDPALGNRGRAPLDRDRRRGHRDRPRADRSGAHRLRLRAGRLAAGCPPTVRGRRSARACAALP